jgi:NAD(P)-dependent dehydrogenase (short-subunit alcohol dehydrogenase family)
MRQRPQDGRLAVVTGASRGIGAATARRLADEGAEVVLVARTAAALQGVRNEIVAAGGRASVIATDLASPPSIDRLVESVQVCHGRVDVLINNAGTLGTATRSEGTDLAQWQSVLDVNLTGPWYLATRLKESMPPGAVVVNISSTAQFYPSVGLAPYCVSKAGMSMLTRVLALEWARDGIRVVGVAPGKVETQLAEPIVQYFDGLQKRYNAMNRLGHPDEVACLFAYLVSHQAAFVTGSTHVIDGGELLDVAVQ